MGKLKIIGLGPGKLKDLTLGAYKNMKDVEKLFLRTKEHPIAEQLLAEEIEFKTFDKVYETESSFEDVYDEITKQIVEMLNQGKDIGYAVPGNPLVAERSVQNLLLELPEEKIDLISGESFLDKLFISLGVDPVEGIQILDGLSFTPDNIQVDQKLILTQVYSRLIASDVKLALLDIYPEEHMIYVIRAAGITEMEKKVEIPLYKLDRLEWIDHLTSLYIPPVDNKDEINFDRLDKFENLVRIMGKLRSSEGCPWDIEQDHESLRTYLIEETYEVLERIDEEDISGLCEELGDLLLQVVFHAQVAKEESDFDIEDVIRGISEKMLRRHPHVFGTEDLSAASDVLKKWEEIKKEEKLEREKTEDQEEQTILKVTNGLPALMEAQKIQKKAAKVGFDWANIEGALTKLEEELLEFKEALMAGQSKEVREELGDFIFAIVNVGRFLDLDMEMVLKDASSKFKKRFQYMESKVEKGDLEKMSLDKLEELWQTAKEKLKLNKGGSKN
jgi:tetrapyrrole methylase family protein/MazG family protein